MSAGFNWHALSTKQKKKLAKRTRTAVAAGVDRNFATTSAAQTMGLVSSPAPAAPSTPTPAAPMQIKPPTQENATIASAGAGVGSGKSRKRMRSGALRIARRKSAANTGTTRGRLNY